MPTLSDSAELPRQLAQLRLADLPSRRLRQLREPDIPRHLETRQPLRNQPIKSTSDTSAPSRNRTNATGTSPHFGSAFATTAASATASWSSSAFSTSMDTTFSPVRMPHPQGSRTALTYSASLRNSALRIFPVDVFGNSANRISLGTLKPANRSATSRSSPHRTPQPRHATARTRPVPRPISDPPSRPPPPQRPPRGPAARSRPRWTRRSPPSGCRTRKAPGQR